MDPILPDPKRPWHQLQDPEHPDHGLVITGDVRTNYRTLIVRCRCMAELHRSSRRFYGYDCLAKVRSLDEAKAVYRRHLETGEKLIRVDLDCAV